MNCFEESTSFSQVLSAVRRDTARNSCLGVH